MGASKRWQNPDNPVDCGPYGEPYWSAEKRRWFRRATDEGKAFLAEWLKVNNVAGLILSAYETRSKAEGYLRVAGQAEFDSMCCFIASEAIPRWYPERSKFSTTLIHVARSMFSDEFRKRKNQRNPPPMTSLDCEITGRNPIMKYATTKSRAGNIDVDPRSANAVEDVDAADLLQTVFDSLTAERRELLSRCLDGEPQRVIGARMGIPLGSITKKIRSLSRCPGVRRAIGIMEDE